MDGAGGRSVSQITYTSTEDTKENMEILLASKMKTAELALFYFT